jgi:hypothetical protein
VEQQAHEFPTAPVAVETILPPVAGVEALLESAAPPVPSPAVPGVVLGTLVGWDSADRPLIAYPGCPVEQPLPALTTVSLPNDACGREAALHFIGGDPLRPLIVGLIQPPRPQPTLAAEAKVDGQRVEFTAEQEIVLRCGKASITLTRAGKVLIEGAYVLSRSSGENRIKGGSVQIN